MKRFALFAAWLLVSVGMDPAFGAQLDATREAISERPVGLMAIAILDRDFPALDEALKQLPLPQQRAQALETLRLELKHEDPAVRRLAAYALSQVDLDESKKNLPALIDALKDPEVRVRARVAFALGEIGPDAKEAVNTLIQNLIDEDPRVRAGAARALGLIGPAARVAIPALVQRLTDKEAPVRCVTAFALGKLGEAAKDALPILESMRSHEVDGNVRAAVTQALQAIAPGKTVVGNDDLTDPDPNRRLVAVSAIMSKGPAAKASVPSLIEAVKSDTDPAVRAGAAFALGKIGAEAKSAVPVLIAALHDPVPRVRTGAAHALGLIGPPAGDAAAALAEAICDEDKEASQAAALALGNLGKAAEGALPTLMGLLKTGTPKVRRDTMNVLARIGPAARCAAPALLEALNDSDASLRQDATRALIDCGPRPDAPIRALIEALRYRDSEIDHAVRAWAGLSLGEMGPRAAEAIPALIKSLQDDDANVRGAAVLALGRIGAPAVGALVKSLDHVDGQVRGGAAMGLGNMGAAARRALPALLEATHDEDPHVRLAAVVALAQIAAGLHGEQDTRVLPQLEDMYKALQDAKAPALSGQEETQWKTAHERFGIAIHGLRTIENAHFWDRMLHSTWFPWAAGIGVYLLFMPLVWMALLRVRPIALLYIGDFLRGVPSIRLPGPLSNMEVSIRGLLLIPLFQHHPRVLDAWLCRRVGLFRENFQEKRTIKDRKVHVPIPVILDGEVIAVPTPRQFGHAFSRRRGCLLIWGEGGVGKTSLACQIAQWAMSEEPDQRLCKHVMLPVLIEHAVDLKMAEGKSPFRPLVAAVRGQLQALMDDTGPLSDEMLDQLLRQRRVLVIVDHLSEIAADARGAIQPGDADFPAHALVVTSRKEEALDGIPRCVVQPLRIQGNRLSTFMEGYLLQRGKRELFDDEQYFDACCRLSSLARGREVTPLFAKLYAEQMIARKESGPDAGLPTNLPDLMLGYVNELNRGVAEEVRRSDFEVQHDAGALAWECIKQTFRPDSIRLDDALMCLGGTDARERLQYLEEQLRLIRTVEPAHDRVCFTLDPLAEYLAALHLVNKYRSEPEAWRDVFSKANALLAVGETVKGFLMAVRDSCVIRKIGPGILDVLEEELSRAA